ncbi:FAD-binding oxidoreductase [Brevibacillus laterosporus]|uniref:FAD-binding oxidoreductase n=1 Tax=Brevibacillus laterosporus TaxID=1465 RepID=UPI002650985B|nr:FAD-linked oxidase C-terminal domain-containing protein [Brevibacillus laterosporus]MDN9008390.1 FAD-linked oxidase C-terminal domain-containing protein [Brevibacillus laterosporus]MDO0939475.1 FAD-linked oxidase C-terminal domain-containing protein [Brevibacillus laterosporus]
MNDLNDLRQLFRDDQVSVNESVLELHSKDESYHTPVLPDVVVFPESREDVSRLLAFANDSEIPVVPFGIGSSLEGHVIPVNKGISLDFQRMNQILEIRPDDLLIRVQPGITRTQVNKELKKYGLFFSVDPGADATLGGMAATNASGTTAVRYGVMRDQVRDLEVALADGSIIHTGGLAAKSSSGYHLNGLFVGSEGTLGVFTELTLRVYGIPEEVMAVRAAFPDVESAVQTAVTILSVGIPVAKIELVDELSIQKINRHKNTSYEATPTLFLEFHGNRAGLMQDAQFARELALEKGCLHFQQEIDSKARAQLWEARHHLYYAFAHSAPGKRVMTTDVCVPLSELAGAVRNAQQVVQELSLEGGVVGHIGDGNYHTLLLLNPLDSQELARAEAANTRIVEYALARGGTCTGEHGVGLGKRKYQQTEHGVAFQAMIAVKKAFDPKGILNPGKIFS